METFYDAAACFWLEYVFFVVARARPRTPCLVREAASACEFPTPPISSACGKGLSKTPCFLVEAREAARGGFKGSEEAAKGGFKGGLKGGFETRA